MIKLNESKDNKEFIIVKSVFSDRDNHDLDIKVNNLTTYQIIAFVSDFLQALIEEDVLDYDTILGIVELSNTPKGCNKEERLKENVGKAIDRLIDKINEMDTDYED